MRLHAYLPRRHAAKLVAVAGLALEGGLHTRHAFTLANTAAPQLQTKQPRRGLSFECVPPLFSLVGLQKASSRKGVNASRTRCQLCRTARRARSVAHARKR